MKKLSLPVIGISAAALLTLGVGGALASGAIGGEVQPTSDDSVYVAPSDTPAATTTDAPVAVVEAPTPTPEPVVPPVQQAPPATVEGVTEPAPQAPAAEPEIVDPESIGTTGADGNYTPAPEPNGVPYVPLPPAPKYPGEPGYVPPTPAD